MNRHQVLTGASNYGDHCFAVGSVEGIHFTVYATGCDIVILASDFQRVQILPGASYGSIQVTCIDCCTEAGKIAASYGKKVCIFEPTPLLHQDSSHHLDYQWYHTGTIEADTEVKALSWHQEGTRLLTAGDTIQMWYGPELPTPPPGDSEEVGECIGGGEGVEFYIDDKENELLEWQCIWHCRPASPVTQVHFSTDGLLFATIGKNDRMVKVWYENKKVQLPLLRTDSVSPKKEEVHFSFIYIAHPRAVTGFSWRKTSKYMPRGSVANMLISSCRDNICRVWCETILPEDGLVDVNQLDPGAHQTPMFHTQRHKRRFMQRLHHISEQPNNLSEQHLMQRRKRQGATITNNTPSQPVPSLPSAQSVHDFHKFGVHPNSVAPGFHFHLAASINPDTDIPLLPAMGTAEGAGELSFVVHWLNNKELHFTLEAERLIDELCAQPLHTAMDEDSTGTDPDTNADADGGDADVPDSGLGSGSNARLIGVTSESAIRDHSLASNKRRRLQMMKAKSLMSTESEFSMKSGISTMSMASHAASDVTTIANEQTKGFDPMDQRIETLLRDWHQSTDMLFSIHPLDGSLLLWLVDWLDEPAPGSFRQAQISFSSRIPSAIPTPDANSMLPHLLLYCNYGNRTDLKAVIKESESKSYVLDSELEKPASGGGTSGSGVPNYQSNAMGKSSPGQSDNTQMPNVLMISKHKNGSLNQWQIAFAENSQFQTVLSLAHTSRVCGHRFQTNNATCHPVLPLLLTTSHHNVPQLDSDAPTLSFLQADRLCDNNNRKNLSSSNSGHHGDPGPGGFCSELILWRVDPVGPLSKSGGISELARINSPETSAFSDVAWLPTLLPSSTLGPYSNSPSALFVASDGQRLCIYQTVIDARSLLQEVSGQRQRQRVNLSRSNSSSSGWMMETPTTHTSPTEVFNIVSQQSTSRPGCIIELDSITDAQQDWQNLQLIHVFQEQLVCGTRSRLPHNVLGGNATSGTMEAMVDLEMCKQFEEVFFLVVLERNSAGQSILHMWRIVIGSHVNMDGNAMYTPDVNYYQEPTPPNSRSNTPEPPASASATEDHGNVSKLSISSTKVCSQILDLPSGVQTVYATVAAGHLSSASIYPACFAPYLLSTACNDGRVHFWRCKTTPGDQFGNDPSKAKYEWLEWDMMVASDNTSAIKVPGKPINVSCAYSGRVAVAYRMGGIKSRPEDPDNKYVNLCVSVYECESTGGSEWTLEDTIELKNITISDPKINIDLSYIYDDHLNHLNHEFAADHQDVILSPTSNTPAIIKSVPIPSLSTVHTVKKMLSVKETKRDVLKPRHLVQLAWVATEDGSHILTVGVGPKLMLYGAVSSEISQQQQKDQTSMASKSQQTRKRGILQKSKSMTVQNFVEEVRWMKIRNIDLSTADGLPPLPMHVSWVRDGILVVGMDNELHVYSQWRCPGDNLDHLGDSISGVNTGSDGLDMRTLAPSSLQKVSSSTSLNLSVNKNYKLSHSMSSIKLDASISNLSLLAEKGLKTFKEKDKDTWSRGSGSTKPDLPKSDSISSASQTNFQDIGLFEAARLANPVLPQYHPKQLIELLNFGKIRRVKAILAHLVKCIAGCEDLVRYGSENNQPGRPRVQSSSHAMTMTGSGPPIEGTSTTLTEDVQSDYLEISSIPPLPLYALLAADDDTNYVNVETGTGSAGGVGSAQGLASTQQQDYSTLFSAESFEDEDEDPFDTEEVFGNVPKTPRERRKSTAQHSFHTNYFGPAQSRLLSRHLIHTQLPGLSSLDQMYLLALADTVANTKLDFSEKNAPDAAVKAVVERERGQTDVLATEGMDDCGLRYLLAARHHVYLQNTLTLRQRAELQMAGLSPAYAVWAFHSEAEEELLNVIPSYQKGEPRWPDLRQFGAGWWLRNINNLRRCMEKVAKASFSANKDPLDAAVFYLAMKKKNVIWGLFRSVNDNKMMQFFKNNFAEERWRKAALKNAFALLGRQRFHHACAFFLLAGAIRDVIEVCLHKLDDMQLALVIVRLHETELDTVEDMPHNMKRLLYEECLGCDQYGKNYDLANIHPDPFIRSMAYWVMKDYSASLGTLLETNIGSGGEKNNDIDGYTQGPSVFNFYNYLRTHPLLVRQNLANTAADKSQTVLLSGFSKHAQKAADKHVTYVDRITPIERRLYFMTAHMHFQNGCPALALEVLSELPDVLDMESDITKSHSNEVVSTPKSPQLDSGILSNQRVDDIDWSTPSKKDTIDTCDWSQPSIGLGGGGTNGLDFDWSRPSTRFDDEKLDLSFEKDEDSDNDSVVEHSAKDKKAEAESKTSSKSAPSVTGDIMAQQLKFLACLKIMMEELATLATGFEVDGGQLRHQLYIWLEKEVQVLQQLCGYQLATGVAGGVGSTSSSQNTSDSGAVSQEECLDGTSTKLSSCSSGTDTRPTLHQVILAEKYDFESKNMRMAKRKEWLLANQQLLRTLLSYSVLHGASGGGLASVRMELILLLQELQQEKSQKQLLSPLPFPTTLPLLSASIASSKTVIADPIRHLQSVTQDILHSIVEFRSPPSPSCMLGQVHVLRHLSASLSACIYQCLCDSDNFVISMSDIVDVGMEGFTCMGVVYKDSHLMAGVQRRRPSSTGEDMPNSPPTKWPGVSSLRTLLARDRDEDAPKLNVLLCESLVAVFMSLLIHALATYDANLLFRLVGHPLDEKIWPTLFGGGVRKLVKVTTTSDVPKGLQAKDDPSKHRMKLNMRVLGPSGGTHRLKEEKPTYREKFVPPEVSIVSYFMTKPHSGLSAQTTHFETSEVDYDSAGSMPSSDEEEEEELIGCSSHRNDAARTEHLDPNSYSWCLMRYAIIKYLHLQIRNLLPQVGVELPELPVCSPLMQSVLLTLDHWESLLQERLDLFAGPPNDYVPGVFVDQSINGPTILKYKLLMEPSNTPFLSHHYSALPAKRLWHHLVNKQDLHQVFIRYVFKRKLQLPEENMRRESDESSPMLPPFEEPMKILHKDQDIISAFCVNQANLNCVAMSTPKEVVEMDVTGVLNPPVWLEDDTEYDIENIRSPSPGKLEAEDFLIVQTPADHRRMAAATLGGTMPPTAPGAFPAPTMPGAQTGRGGSVIKGINIPGITNPNFSCYIVDRSRRLMRSLTQRPVPGVRRMGAHPHLPYYLTGSQDGSVKLWEWCHSQCIAVARQPGCFPKVSKVLFNAQGNKFGVSDSEGSVCLWQVGLGVNMNKPYLSLRCHNKAMSDFVFVGSSSLLATAGHSSESRNVCLWDTLLPQRSAMVQAFHCHSDGAPAIVYAPQHQTLITAGKKGDICLFDVRQRQMRQTFQAHDSPIKCLCLDPREEFFVSGSADGDIKVWALQMHSQLYSFPGEHLKGSIFRNVSAGVCQLYISPDNHLFSCGADGSMRVRRLPNRDSIVQSFTSSNLSTATQ